MTCEKIFGESLGAFELGGGLARAKAAQTGGLKAIDHTGNQRRFRSDDGQVNGLFLSKAK
jgi:hypothetical protein